MTYLDQTKEATQYLYEMLYKVKELELNEVFRIMALKHGVSERFILGKIKLDNRFEILDGVVRCKKQESPQQ